MHQTGVREPLLAGSESEKGAMERALRHPANRNPPLGCVSATGPNMKEVVVYDNALAYPGLVMMVHPVGLAGGQTGAK